MNIEDLVPPFELCRQIPAGEFADTAFVWAEISKFCETVLIRRRFVEKNLRTAPAPTLQEVLAVCKDIATLPPDPKYTKVFDLTKLTPQNTLEIYLSKIKKEPHNANC